MEPGKEYLETLTSYQGRIVRTIKRGREINELVEEIRKEIPQIDMIGNIDNDIQFWARKRISGRIFFHDEFFGVDFDFQCVPYEQVVEWIAGPIHRKYNVDWSLRATEDSLVLRTHITRGKNEHTIQLDISESPVIGCRIIKNEIEPFVAKRYSFSMKC
jgi:hypothetical protein